MRNIIRKENLEADLSGTHIKRVWSTSPGQTCSSGNEFINIHPDSTLLIIGDSIMDYGRLSPADRTIGDFLGYSYIKLINNLLAATGPRQHIRILNRGISQYRT
ncbi:MAG: hypothetical protein ACLPSL_08805 [Smithella sp.]